LLPLLPLLPPLLLLLLLLLLRTFSVVAFTHTLHSSSSIPCSTRSTPTISRRTQSHC
jgi:hypothetical protein